MSINYSTNITNITNIIDINSFDMILNEYKNNYYLSYNIIIIFFNIIGCDFSLCILFGLRGRWFQLHALINFIISIDILPSVIHIIRDPNSGYKLLDNHIPSYYIACLHLYHILTFKNLNYYDYFHHILFVGLGVMPSIRWIKYNQILLGYIACSGIPGIIEYGTLALYKNNKITLLQQKELCSLVYIYLRYPLCIYGVTSNYLAYNNNLIKDNLLLTIYINFLLYLNGSFFTQLTLDSFHKIKYTKKTE